MIDDPDTVLMQYCADALGVSKQDYVDVHSKFQADFQKGLFTEEQFWAKICSGLKVTEPKAPSLWTQAFEAAYSAKKEMFSLAGTLRRNGYKTVILSDTEPPAMEYFYRQGYDMFDVFVFSCAEGTKKPERKIYELALERLGVAASEAVFIDNREDFTEGAEQVGLNTVLFESVEQVKNELALLGVKTD